MLKGCNSPGTAVKKPFNAKCKIKKTENILAVQNFFDFLKFSTLHWKSLLIDAPRNSESYAL